MFEVQGKQAIRARYKVQSRASSYIKNRFSEPIWAMAHNKQISFINGLIQELRPKTILDLACGPGRISKDLDVTSIENAVAVDASSAMLQEAKLNLDSIWNIHKVDAFHTPFDSETFDMVVSFRFLRHFAYDDRTRLYAEIHRLLNPNKGTLIFDVLNTAMLRGSYIERFTGAWDKSIYDETYSLPQIKDEMSHAGFTFERALPIMSDWKALLTTQQNLKNKTPHNKIVTILESEDAKESKYNFMWVTAWQKK